MFLRLKDPVILTLPVKVCVSTILSPNILLPLL